uniref:Uncharacterized protein n=1 Tax=Maconellicoccus hirsutus TaxID=177089 RepID=A2I480_MACHI|nr:hypothetical protein [Maconellicoccus hirsutus]
MATYAAYRHIELDKVGAGKKRVLKPPGGGSSDIFGKDGSNDEKPVIRKKSGQSSSIVLNDDVSPAPAENGHAKQGTCNERLFGPPLELNGTNSVAKTNGEILTNGKDHTDAPKTNGESLTNGKGGGFEAPKPATNAAPRQRVPPGGFSSGLW